nr:vasopressin,Arg [Tachyglossus aculeatus]
CYFQNCPLR